MRITPSETVTVLLDGNVVPHFLYADPAEGWVRVNDELVLRGKVEVLPAVPKQRERKTR